MIVFVLILKGKACGFKDDSLASITTLDIWSWRSISKYSHPSNRLVRLCLLGLIIEFFTGQFTSGDVPPQSSNLTF